MTSTDWPAPIKRPAAADPLRGMLFRGDTARNRRNGSLVKIVKLWIDYQGVLTAKVCELDTGEIYAVKHKDLARPMPANDVAQQRVTDTAPKRTQRYLTEAERAEIVRVAASGQWSQNALARHFGCSQPTIGKVLRAAQAEHPADR